MSNKPNKNVNLFMTLRNFTKKFEVTSKFSNLKKKKESLWYLSLHFINNNNNNLHLYLSTSSWGRFVWYTANDVEKGEVKRTEDGTEGKNKHSHSKRVHTSNSNHENNILWKSRRKVDMFLDISSAKAVRPWRGRANEPYTQQNGCVYSLKDNFV